MSTAQKPIPQYNHESDSPKDKPGILIVTAETYNKNTIPKQFVLKNVPKTGRNYKVWSIKVNEKLSIEEKRDRLSQLIQICIDGDVKLLESLKRFKDLL